MRVLLLAVALAGAGWPGPVEAPAVPPQAAPTPAVSAQDEDSTLTWSVRPTPSDEEPERPNFSYELDPGATVEDSIRVRNFGDEPLPLAVYASDALTTSSGALDLLPAGEEPTGVGAWIVPDTAAIEVPPQDFVDVPFTMVVPAGAESGDHAGGIVTSFRTPGTDAEGRPVVVDRRLGSRVYVRVAGELTPRLEVSEVSVSFPGSANPLDTGDLHVSYTVTNTGNVRLGAEQTVSVPGRLGLPGREATLDQMPELLPSHSLTFSVDVPDVWPTFRTTGAVELRPVPTREGDEFGAEPVATGSAGTWSIPWPQLAVLLVLAGGVWWAIASRRRRRRREAAARHQATQTATIVQEAVKAVLAATPDRAAPAATPDRAAPPPESATAEDEHDPGRT